MARIEGTGPKQPTASQRARRSARRLRLEPVASVVILAPAVILAPEQFIVAILVPIVIAAAYLIGYANGRRDLAQRLVLDMERPGGLRRDDQAA